MIKSLKVIFTVCLSVFFSLLFLKKEVTFNIYNVTVIDSVLQTTDIEYIDSLTIENLKASLQKHNVKYSDIVLTQAILETGHFKSRICKEYNNLFGLYNSRTKDFYKFNHWSESVKGYVDLVQYKYKDGCYYTFLQELGYAEDPLYINKLKQLSKQFNE